MATPSELGESRNPWIRGAATLLPILTASCSAPFVAQAETPTNTPSPEMGSTNLTETIASQAAKKAIEPFDLEGTTYTATGEPVFYFLPSGTLAKMTSFNGVTPIDSEQWTIGTVDVTDGKTEGSVNVLVGYDSKTQKSDARLLFVHMDEQQGDTKIRTFSIASRTEGSDMLDFSEKTEMVLTSPKNEASSIVFKYSDGSTESIGVQTSPTAEPTLPSEISLVVFHAKNQLSETPETPVEPTKIPTSEPTTEPTSLPSPTTESKPTIPEAWMNWKGDIKDFASYITIEKISDLDRIIAYDRAHDTTTFPSPTVCDQKLTTNAQVTRTDFLKLEYVLLNKHCSKADLPAHEIIGARMKPGNGQPDTFLFIIQKRYTPEGFIYMKYVSSQAYIESTYSDHQYYLSLYKELSRENKSIGPVMEYTPGFFETGANEYLEQLLSREGYQYDKTAVKEMLTELLTHSQNNTPVPQELRDRIESTLFFPMFNSW
jgi:hypothetical protein